jgi:hypothetical protein
MGDQALADIAVAAKEYPLGLAQRAKPSASRMPAAF